MFVGVKALDETGSSFFLQVNPFHVVKITIYNLKNIEEGSLILLRTGEELFTPDPIDVVSLRFNEVIERFTQSMLIQIVNEYAQSNQVKKRGRPKKVN